MADFKDLHSKWKDAKKSVKTFCDMLGRQTMDVSSAPTQFCKPPGPARRLLKNPPIPSVSGEWAGPQL